MIYKNIKKICEEKGIAISKLEKDAGLSNGAISKWAVSAPRVQSLYNVALCLGVPLEDLIKGPDLEK